jgi:hypothetical protein
LKWLIALDKFFDKYDKTLDTIDSKVLSPEEKNNEIIKWEVAVKNYLTNLQISCLYINFGARTWRWGNLQEEVAPNLQNRERLY